MLRTGVQYRDSIRDGRRVWIDGERVKDVASHPAFRPIVDIRARIYDMQHDEATADIMVTHDRAGRPVATGLALPYTQDDWWAKRRALDAVLDDVGGVGCRLWWPSTA